MKNSKAGFSKEEVKRINENAIEYDLWWRPEAQLLKVRQGKPIRHSRTVTYFN